MHFIKHVKSVTGHMWILQQLTTFELVTKQPQTNIDWTSLSNAKQGDCLVGMAKVRIGNYCITLCKNEKVLDYFYSQLQYGQVKY